MPKMREKVAVFVICISATVAACGGGGQTNPCEKLTNSCSTEGLRQCTSDNKGVQTCEKNKDGCLVWSSALACGERQECTVSGIDASCRCKNECNQEGLTKCQGGGEIIDECTKDSFGCLYWKAGADCATENKFCNETEQGASCAETCQDKCEPGNLRCVSDWLQGCAKLGQCADWQNSVNCADKNQMCSEVTGKPGCYDICQDECDTENAVQCKDKFIQTCKRDGDDDICLEWTNTTDCSKDNPTNVCAQVNNVPTCVCSDECPANGVNKCDENNPNDLWTCAADGDPVGKEDSCLEWKFAAHCQTTERPTDICEEANNTASCVCTNECPAEGAKRCVGNNLEVCAANGDADKCLEWKFDTDCTQGGTSTDICQVVNDQAQCVCVDECSPANSLRCDSTFKWVQICSAGPQGDDTCLEWNNQEDCSQLGPMASCSTQNGAHCELGCTDDCTEQELGVVRCGVQGQNQVVEKCEATADGCRHWVTQTTCTGNTPVCDATMTPPICIGTCTELLVQPYFYTIFLSSLPAQDFSESNLSAYDSWLADDITFNASTTIDSIVVPGYVSGGQRTLARATTLNFAIYADNNGLPANRPGGTGPAPIWTLSVPPTDAQVTLVDNPVTSNFGTVILRPTTPITLDAGTYWFFFWPVMSYGTGGMFRWLAADINTQNGYPGQFINPGNGFQMGSDWISLENFMLYDLGLTLWQGQGCCPNACPALDSQACSTTNEDVLTCVRGAPECGHSGYQWQAASVCTGENSCCDDSTGVPTCAPPVTCSNVITGTGQFNGDNTSASDNYLGLCAGSTGGKDVCFAWTAPDNGTYQFDTLGSTLNDTVIYVYRCARQIACNEDVSSSEWRSRVQVAVTQGTQYVIIVDGFDDTTVGPFVLNITKIN